MRKELFTYVINRKQGDISKYACALSTCQSVPLNRRLRTFIFITIFAPHFKLDL